MKNYLKQVRVKNRIMRFPVYFPDATRAVIRSLDSQDLQQAGIEGLILNPYHLASHPGIKVLKKFQGVAAYMNWPGFVLTDSGGWQLLSLVYKDPKFGRIDNQGVTFFKDSLGRHQKYLFTPEKSIQNQLELKADVVICLDDCPGKNASQKQIETSVRRTIDWAKRCKIEFVKQTKKLKEKPLLLAVVQGGRSKKLRSFCAKELVEINFDAYGWGGWTANKKGGLDIEIGSYIVSQLPQNKPKFALGVGYPWDIIKGFKAGYHIFDCVVPTREARHKRLYLWKKDPEKINLLKANPKQLFAYFYPDKQKQAFDKNPVDKYCDCHLCQNYSRAYLRHLFKIQDSLAWRLATIHNLRVYSKLIQALRYYVS